MDTDDLEGIFAVVCVRSSQVSFGSDFLILVSFFDGATPVGSGF